MTCDYCGTRLKDDAAIVAEVYLVHDECVAEAHQMVEQLMATC